MNKTIPLTHDMQNYSDLGDQYPPGNPNYRKLPGTLVISAFVYLGLKISWPVYLAQPHPIIVLSVINSNK